MRRAIALVVAASIVVACSSSSPATDGASAPPTDSAGPPADPVATLVEAACPDNLTGSPRFSCAALTVPESRSTGSERTVELPVLTISASGTATEPPLLVLGGGPGNSTIDQAFAFVDSALGEDRDILLAETRGAGHARPSLDCPEVHAVHRTLFSASRADTTSGLTTALAECRGRLVDAGIDLDAYTTAAAAADLVDLRTVAGHRQWDVYGPSYGGLLAQELVRTPDNGVRRAVLDSPVPPDVAQGGSQIAARSASAVERLAQHCADDPACPADPPLVDQVRDLVDRLDRQPLVVETDGDPISISGADAYAMVFFAMYRTDVIPLIPSLIAEFDQLAPAVLPDFVAGILKSFDAISIGMSLSVSCADHAGLEPSEDFDATVAAHPQNSTLWQLFPTPDRCTVWDVAAQPASSRVLVAVDTEVLLLAGALDPIADPADTRRIHAALPASTLAEIPGRGHGVLGSDPCSTALVQAFLATGIADIAACDPGQVTLRTHG